MEQEKIPYIFIGFDLRTINIKKNQNEKLKELRIGVASSDFDKNSNTLSIAIKVELDYEENKNNELIYASGFRLFDNDMIKVAVGNDKKYNEFIPMYVSSVFPFIRENIATITKDMGKQIVLPTVDCRMFNLEEEIILTNEE